MNEKEFVPFGKEWESEMMRLSKKQLIALFKQMAQEQSKPTDEGIKDEAQRRFPIIELSMGCFEDYNKPRREDFEEGAKWARGFKRIEK